MNPLADLRTYRERRQVRRAGAYLVIAIGVLGVLEYAHRALTLLDATIRQAAQLLPDEADVDA